MGERWVISLDFEVRKEISTFYWQVEGSNRVWDKSLPVAK